MANLRYNIFFMKYLLLSLILLSTIGCYDQVERKCSDFKNGTFEVTNEINGEKIVTRIYRKDSFGLDTYQGRTDTVNIKWINDCEFITRIRKPRSLSEKDAIHIKILSTTDSSYIFEYAKVVKTQREDYLKLRGTAIKIN